MTVKELCSNYDLKFQTVYKKISHHRDKELAGHFTKAKGESLELDDFAVDFLLPTHVKVMQTGHISVSLSRPPKEMPSLITWQGLKLKSSIVPKWNIFSNWKSRKNVKDRNGQGAGVMVIQDNLFPIPWDIHIHFFAFALRLQFSLR